MACPNCDAGGNDIIQVDDGYLCIRCGEAVRESDMMPAEMLAARTGRPQEEYECDDPMPELDELTWERVEDDNTDP